MAHTDLSVVIKTEPKESSSETDDEEVSADTLLFICGICEQKFSCYDALQSHLILHSGQQSLTCEICNKSFMYIGELKLHVLSHSFEKHFTGQLSKKFSGDKNKHNNKPKNDVIIDHHNPTSIHKIQNDKTGKQNDSGKKVDESSRAINPVMDKLTKGFDGKVEHDGNEIRESCSSKEESRNKAAQCTDDSAVDIVRGSEESTRENNSIIGQLTKKSNSNEKDLSTDLLCPDGNKISCVIKKEIYDESFPSDVDNKINKEKVGVLSQNSDISSSCHRPALIGTTSSCRVTLATDEVQRKEESKNNISAHTDEQYEENLYTQAAKHLISTIETDKEPAMYLHTTIPSSNSNKGVKKKNSASSGKKSPKVKSAGNVFSCIYCVKTFATQVQLNRHTKAHTCEKKFVCDHDGCTMRFGTNSDLKKHKRTHTGEKPHQCPICNKRFTTKGSQNRHIRSCVPHDQVPGIQTYSCEYCQKVFTKRSQLKRHLRIHTGEKPFKCEFCGRSFCNSGDRKQHLRIHTGERPYKCDYCDKTFSSSSNRKQHIRIHTGYKPFICDFCGKAFRNTNEIKRHIKIHIGEKTYKCGVCDKRFSQQSNLQQHFRIHTGEKPYVCDFCEKAFSRKSHLNRHYKIHTREVMEAAKLSFSDGTGDSPFTNCPPQGASFMDVDPDDTSESESNSDEEDQSFTDSEPNDLFSNSELADSFINNELQKSFSDNESKNFGAE